MISLSKRVEQLSPSPTLAITATAKSLKQQGYNVIGLGAGEPDFNTPVHILDAAERAMKAGNTKYTASSGIQELKEAVVEKLKRDNDLAYSTEQVTVTVGAKDALYNLFQVIINPGDEVIIPAPYWVSYIEQVKLAGGVPVVIEAKEEQSFQITPEQLEEAITPQTKALIINSPSNPTGMLYETDKLHALGEVAIQHNLLIVSDEIYEHLIYDDEEQHVSIASLSDKLYEHTVVINGVSKTYSMTGWRIGFAAGPVPIIRAMTDLASHSTSNPTSISQYAALEALTGTQEPVEEMKKAFKERREYVMERIQTIPGIHCLHPPGAFYAFINIESLLGERYQSSDDWSRSLLEEKLVAVVPGSAFGADSYIRISYATSRDQLQEAFDRIESFITQ